MIHKDKRNPKWIAMSAGLMSILAFIVNTQAPEYTLALSAFFLTLFLLIAALLYLVTNNVRRSWLWATFFLALLLLRYFELLDLIYYAFLIAIALSLELYIRKR